MSSLNLGLSYDIPLNPADRMSQAASNTPQVAPHQFAAYEGLQDIDNVTSNFYNDYGALKALQSQMAGMGIDVTAPNPMLPGSIEVSTLFMKAMASIEQRGNELKNKQSMLNQFLQSQAYNPNYEYDGNVQEGFRPELAQNLGAQDRVKMRNISYRSPATEEARHAMSLDRGKFMMELEQELANARTPQERNRVEAQMQALTEVDGVTPSYGKLKYDDETTIRIQGAYNRVKDATSVASFKRDDLNNTRTLLSKDGNTVDYSISDGEAYILDPDDGSYKDMYRLGNLKHANNVLNKSTEEKYNSETLDYYMKHPQAREIGIPEVEWQKAEKSQADEYPFFFQKGGHQDRALEAATGADPTNPKLWSDASIQSRDAFWKYLKNNASSMNLSVPARMQSTKGITSKGQVKISNIDYEPQGGGGFIVTLKGNNGLFYKIDTNKSVENYDLVERFIKRNDLGYDEANNKVYTLDEDVIFGNYEPSDPFGTENATTQSNGIDEDKFNSVLDQVDQERSR